MGRSKNRDRRVIPLNATRRVPVSNRPQNHPYFQQAHPLTQAYYAANPHEWPEYVIAANHGRNMARAQQGKKTRRHLTLVEDRRQWHPEGPNRDARSFSRFRSGLTALKYGAISTVAFRGSPSVLACVRRKARRNVLFAKRKTGRVGQKRPRFNWLSKISCRRK